MPTSQSLKQEIESLKDQVSKLNKTALYFKKNQIELLKRIISLEQKNESLEKVSTPTIINSTQKIDSTQKIAPEKKESSSSFVLSIILIILGSILTLTLIGAIIGLPLLIWGIIRFSNNIDKKDNSLLEQNSEIKSKTSLRQANLNTKVDISDSNLKSKPFEKKEASFEEDVGMKWFLRIGILALVMGIGFFIKYAIDMDWINHLTRIILGIVIGIGIIIFGEIISKNEKYEIWAKTLVGGGIAIIYFSVYAMYYFQEYRTAIGISQTLDIILLILVGIFAIFYSLKSNSEIIAGEYFLLGYATLLLSINFEFITLIYGLILTIGLVSIVSYKKWSLLGIGGLIASYLMYLVWILNNSISFAYSSFILISFFVLFSIQSIFLIKDKKLIGQNIGLLLTNSLLFFILYFIRINDIYPKYTGLFTLIVSIIYFIFYYLTSNSDETQISNTALYLALFYLTLTIPVQLNSEWITIIWALETLILTLLFIKNNNLVLRLSSYAVGIFTILKTFFYDSFFLDKLNFNSLLTSTRVFSYLITIICFYIIYNLLKNNKQLLSDSENYIPELYSWFASGFLVFITIIELVEDNSKWVSIIFAIIILILISIFKLNPNAKELKFQALLLSALLFFKVLIFDIWYLNSNSNFLLSEKFYVFALTIIVFYAISSFLVKNLNNNDSLNQPETTFSLIYSYAGTILAFAFILSEMENIWVSIGWSILALILTISGFAYKNKQLRLQGIIIFAIVILKVFIYDIRNLETIYKTISYIVLGIILLLVSFIYTKYNDKLKELL